MKYVVVHPENAAWIRRHLCNTQREEQIRLMGFQIVEDPHVPIEEPSGCWILPDRCIVIREDIKIRDRFIEYGPEDFEWLKYSGRIREHFERVFYLVDPLMLDPMFRPVMDMMINDKPRVEFPFAGKPLIWPVGGV